MSADPRILHSIYGRRFGLTRGGSVISDGHLKIASYRDRGVLNQLLDHFTGSTLNSNDWTTKKGSDGACALPFIPDSVGGGKCRLTTGAGAVLTMAVNGSQFFSALQWDMARAVGSIPMAFGGSAQLARITSACFFIGMADQDSALQMPFTIAGGVLTANATDGYGFLFDTAATAATWKFVGVANGVATAIGDTGIAPVAATDDLFMIENDGAGNATFWLDDVPYGTVGGCGRAAHLLTPTVAMFSRSAVSTTADVDFLNVENSR